MSELLAIDLIKNLQVHQIWWDDSISEPVSIRDDAPPVDIETDVEVKGNGRQLKQRE